MTSYDWIECVGCADRSAYDLSVHSKVTGTPLVVKEARPEPLKITQWQAVLEKKLVGPRLKKVAKKVETAVAGLDQTSLERLAIELAEETVISVPTETLADGRDAVELSQEVCSIKQVTRVENTREYTPNQCD